MSFRVLFLNTEYIWGSVKAGKIVLLIETK
jgi:hypothetical protein